MLRPADFSKNIEEISIKCSRPTCSQWVYQRIWSLWRYHKIHPTGAFYTCEPVPLATGRFQLFPSIKIDEIESSFRDFITKQDQSIDLSAEEWQSFFESINPLKPFIHKMDNRLNLLYKIFSLAPEKRDLFCKKLLDIFEFFPTSNDSDSNRHPWIYFTSKKIKLSWIEKALEEVSCKKLYDTFDLTHLLLNYIEDEKSAYILLIHISAISSKDRKEVVTLSKKCLFKPESSDNLLALLAIFEQRKAVERQEFYHLIKKIICYNIPEATYLHIIKAAAKLSLKDLKCFHLFLKYLSNKHFVPWEIYKVFQTFAALSATSRKESLIATMPLMAFLDNLEDMSCVLESIDSKVEEDKHNFVALVGYLWAACGMSAHAKAYRMGICSSVCQIPSHRIQEFEQLIREKFQEGCRSEEALNLIESFTLDN